MSRRLLLSSLIFWTACGGSSNEEPLDSGAVVTDSGQPPSDSGVMIEGQASYAPALLDFGVVVFSSTVVRTLTLSNPTGTAARVSLAEVTGPDAAMFTFGAFAARELAPGESVTIDFTFTAGRAEGAKFASIIVSTCAGGCPQVLSMTAEVRENAVRCSPIAVDFGIVSPGQCTTRSITCANEANVDVTIETATLDPLGDPEFAVDATRLPLELPAGASGGVEVVFCPGSVGDFFGRVTILEEEYELSGHGGGGLLSCAPGTLDLGTVGVGSCGRRGLVCSNSGPEALNITEILTESGSAEIVADPSSLAIGAGTSTTITITWSPLGAGALSDVLLVRSDAPNAPELRIPLTGEAVEVGGDCVPVLTPGTFNFGLVGIGEARAGSIELRNTGTTPCLIASVAATFGGPLAVTPPTSGEAIGPGQTLRIDAVFSPVTVGPASGQVQTVFANPNAPSVTALFEGVGADLDLVASPSAVDFGDVAVGCAAPALRTVTLQNSTPGIAVISAIGLANTSSGSFAIENLPSTPLILGFLETVELTVRFDPAQVGGFADAIVVTVAGEAAPILLPLWGAGAANSARVDTASLGAPKIDVLFMIDNSVSMEAGQSALAAAIPGFVSALVGSGADFRVALVTTDMVDPAHSGRFQGTPSVIDASTPDVAQVIVDRVRPGIDGDGTAESPFAAMVAALTPPLADNENAGFLRDDARLVIIALSDEDDQSGTDVALVAGALRATAGADITVYSIVGDGDGACNGPQGPAASSPRWAELDARLGGEHFSYCDPVGESMEAITARLFTVRVELSADPVPETIAVTQNGAPVPTGGWRYVRVDNSVVFTGALSADPIAISYDAFCLSASCGDGTVDLNESCDDNNAANDDACTDGCRLAICGDGFVSAGNEACDDANLVESDACLSTCTGPICGDDILSAGEDCDDGNTTDGDGCPATCVYQTDVSGYYTVAPLAPHIYSGLGGAATLLVFTDLDDGVGAVTVPFAFNFFGSPLTMLDVSPNGLVAANGLTDLNSFTNGSLPNLALPNGVIAAWWDDLVVDPAITSGAFVAYEVQGTAPNRVLVIEWRNVRRADHMTNSHRRFTFQIALFEGSNAIELRYGETATSGNPATATSASVGVENQDATVGENLLGCSPSCAGPPRPGNPNGFPRASVITLTP